MPTVAAPANQPDRSRALVDEWQLDGRVSARSVLVTLLGDAIAPLGGSVWLADLIALGASLGFNERLVRTSVFRLTGEGWVTSERRGRRSRYLLTDYATAEIDAVNERIYGMARPETTTGEWLLVFLGLDGAGSPAPQLRWHGFAELRPGVWGRRGAHPELARQLFARLGLSDEPVTALARFENPDRLVAAPTFRESSGLAATEEAYRFFLDRYGAVVVEAFSEPEAAFVLRTMVIHDFRRVRLADPELPAETLGEQWIGTRARELAAHLYRGLADRSWQWLERTTGLELAAGHPARTGRFTEPSLVPSGGPTR